jgi:tetratricopeptide (TPR) repeat protein
MKNGEKALSNELLQYERKRRNWSREYVAQQVSAPEVRMVGRWEREGVLPHPDYRQRLCELFSKSARELGFVEPDEVPFWHIPYRRNSFFTGRETLLGQIQDFLSTNHAAALTQPGAISGLGGIGKTQVALEYAYRFGQQYQAVLWVRAESREALTSDFAVLAAVLNLPEKEAQEQSRAVDAVKGWLAALSRWLLILDNVEDLQLLGEFLPQAVKGRVLLTTRLQAGRPRARLIEVEVMEPEESALFLLRRAGIIAPEAPPDSASYADWTRARAIGQIMGGLPLALDQAGAYIEETQCSLDGYLDRYQTHGNALLRERGETASDHPAAVVGTFLLSLEKVERANPAAADLLRLCAFLAPDAIPEEIISDGAAELGPILEVVAADPILLDRAIKDLLKYSLLRRYPDARTLTVHRLVQVVFRESMDEDTQRLWAVRTVHAVDRVFPEVEFATWALCQRCLPHAQACAALIEQRGMEFTAATRLLNQTGYYLRVRAHYAEAEPLLIRGLATREQALGPDDPAVATSLSDLAELYRDQGKYTQAEPLYQRALAIRERALGPGHLDVATILDNLTELYRIQSKYAQAETLLTRALAISEQTPGPQNPATARCLNNLALIYYYQGKYEQAEPLFHQVLAIREKALGPEHPDVAQTLNGLAELYDAQGKYIQAEVLLQRTLTIRERALGPRHPELATTLNNLAAVYSIQGKYEEAEPLYQQALIMREQVFGPNHPHVATSLNNLALFYHAQGNEGQVEQLLQRALASREQAFGPEHSNVANSLNNLASFYRIQGKYEQAEPLYQRALTIWEKVLPSNHPNIAQTLNALGRLYYAQGKYEQAEPLYQRALTIRERALGLTHADTISSLADLANLYYAKGQYEQAEMFYQRVLAVRERIPGTEHPGLVSILENYATLLRATNREAEAAELETQVQMIHNKKT